MSYLVSSFVAIVRCVSDDRVHCEEESRIADLFSDEFDDLDFELVLCCFEATHKMAFQRRLAEATFEEYGRLTIEEFLETYIEPAEQRDPLFITNTFLMFRNALESALLPPEEEEDEFN